jgi:multidrug efflux pump subunit AcrA (membrane-fusion protein)
VVFVIDGDMARQRPVKLGWREDNWVEVLEGVSAQEQVVTEGSASIRDGSRIIISGDSAAP